MADDAQNLVDAQNLDDAHTDLVDALERSREVGAGNGISVDLSDREGMTWFYAVSHIRVETRPKHP